ncbi:MAG TPA: hypothetical protein PKE12_11680 [Kiritimatiellia bacterium]|nr:hypothetical protein [Kiritimatiellia bacterium]
MANTIRRWRPHRGIPTVEFRIDDIFEIIHDGRQRDPPNRARHAMGGGNYRPLAFGQWAHTHRHPAGLFAVQREDAQVQRLARLHARAHRGHDDAASYLLFSSFVSLFGCCSPSQP